MAQKKKAKKKSWLKTALIYIFVPLSIWFFAFVLWLYWDSVTGLFSKDKAPERSPARPSRTREKTEKPAANPPQEKILDDDRKQLDEILKRK